MMVYDGANRSVGKDLLLFQTAATIEKTKLYLVTERQKRIAHQFKDYSILPRMNVFTEKVGSKS